MLTLPKVSMLALFLLLLVTSKNLGKNPALVILSAGVAVLHLYDHLFLVKRRKENYCGACKM
jgi:hypothetical protein